MHKRLSLGLTLGFIGNLMFLAFTAVSYWYYRIFEPDNTFVRLVEILAYAVLYGGFLMLAAADIILWITVSMRTVVKSAFAGYIIMEAAIMYCELNAFTVRNFYNSYSMGFAIIHSVLSAAVCFAFVYLDPYKTEFEVTVIICIGLILGGMFGSLMGMRIYFGIMLNAIAFAVLFFAIKRMIKKEIIEIDCIGDSARVAEYRSVFFEEEVDDDEEDEDTAPEPEKAPESAKAPEKEKTSAKSGKPAGRSEKKKSSGAPESSRKK